MVTAATIPEEAQLYSFLSNVIGVNYSHTENTTYYTLKICGLLTRAVAGILKILGAINPSPPFPPQQPQATKRKVFKIFSLCLFFLYILYGVSG